MGSPTLGSANLESWTIESLDQRYIFVVFFGSPESTMILRATFSLSYKTICLLKKSKIIFCFNYSEVVFIRRLNAP